jgi:hypothetical protein
MSNLQLIIISSVIITGLGICMYLMYKDYMTKITFISNKLTALENYNRVKIHNQEDHGDNYPSTILEETEDDDDEQSDHSEHIVNTIYEPNEHNEENYINSIINSNIITTNDSIDPDENSEDIRRDIENLKDTLGESWYYDTNDDDENQNIVESNNIVVDDELKTSGSNGVKNNMSQFDELDDTEHIDNNELDSYMNHNILGSKLNNNLELEIELDAMSNSSIIDNDVNTSNSIKADIIYNNWKITDLKELCKTLNVSGKGNKLDIIKRLLNKDSTIFEHKIENSLEKI